VTTAALAERCKRWNRRVQVVPNSLDERLIARREPRPRKTAFGERPLVVGVMGTRTHDHDLAVVRDAIELLGSRSDVAFEVCGAVTDQSWWRDRGVRVRDVSGPEEEYPLFMTWWSESIAWDVGLAALAPTVFNASKSDVKVLDYAAIAAAGVYSAGPAYDESIRHGESGLLVEYEARAWADAIATLAADDELRLALARRAVSDLWSGRVLAHRAPDWAEALAAMVSS
jgi:glycosyltransferase involved in cell wall biosynthesis